MSRTKCSPRVKFLGQPQVAAVYRAAKERSTRDRLLIALLYRLGCRISEAIGVRTDDVNLDRGEITIRAAKGGATRTYSIPADIRPVLRAHVRHGAPGAFLLASRQGERLGRTRAWAVVKDVYREAGIPAGYGPHSLRHSVAVHSLDAGAELVHVKDLLRHASIRSTEIYADVSPATRAAYAAVLDGSPAVVKVRP